VSAARRSRPPGSLGRATALLFAAPQKKRAEPLEVVIEPRLGAGDPVAGVAAGVGHVLQLDRHLDEPLPLVSSLTVPESASLSETDESTSANPFA